jgi:bacterioferritin (cytochrome b1)
VLRYMHHYFMATGVHGKFVADEFKEHADDEREHADGLAERIQQLGGKPDFNPASLVSRSVAQYIEGETLADMIREDLIAERVVIELYTEMIRFFGEKDPTTRVLLERILADEEQHATDLTDLLYIVEPSTGKVEGMDPGADPLARAKREVVQAQTAQATQRRGPQAVPARGRPTGISANEEPLQREPRPSRTAARQRPAEIGIPPAHPPGTTGHPTRQRGHQFEADEDIEEPVGKELAGQTGTSRAPRISRPNRKQRQA